MKKIIVQGAMLMLGIAFAIKGTSNDTYFIVSQIWLVGSMIVGEIQ